MMIRCQSIQPLQVSRLSRFTPASLLRFMIYIPQEGTAP
mgnify:CR=1 FL=1